MGESVIRIQCEFQKPFNITPQKLFVYLLCEDAGPLSSVGRELAGQTKALEQPECGRTPFLIST